MNTQLHEKSKMPVLAIVRRDIFEDDEVTPPAERKLGGVLSWWGRYASNQRLIAAAADRRAQLFLVTVRHASGVERLWLVAHYPEIRKVRDGCESTGKNTLPITDITHLRRKLKFDKGNGIISTPGLLAKSLQMPRILTPEDVDLLVEAVHLGNPQWKGLKRLTELQRDPTLDTASHDANHAGAFDPENPKDAREKIQAAIVQRRGQPGFRKKLLELYRRKCIITGCNAEQALEAAHILPYKGKHTNHPENGLLLRADLHTLFDLRLIAVDTSNMSLVLAQPLRTTNYGSLHGKHLNIPEGCPHPPSIEALDKHRVLSGI